ncbi:MAG TPA: NHL repeat-containing protein [Chthoniobacterales bacterium]|jgi:sugar lactone lactonase YvrE
MKFLSPQRFFLSVALGLSALPGARAQFTNGQNAAHVWGQPNFTASATAANPTDGTLATPSGIAVDPTTGKFFVADTANNRVLRYRSTAAYDNGASAEIAFGQETLFSKVAAVPPEADTMNAPQGVAVDTSGNLWVADTGNNRVLKFTGASKIATSGPDANAFFGQEEDDTGTPTTSQRGMNAPTGLAFDSAGALYVADKGNNRVLKFNGATSLASYAFADGIFGQAALSNGQGNFLASTAGLSNSAFNAPVGVAVDLDGNLWVADSGNHRVLKFASVTTQPINGSAIATLVLGQTNFTSNIVVNPPTASTLRGPSGVAFDPLGRLYVADTINNRVVIYQSPSTLIDGGAATFVLGQATFITNAATLPTTSQTSLNGPRGVVFSQNFIFVTDATTSRMVNFAITPGTPVVIGSSKYTFKYPRKKAFNFSVYNTGASDVFTIGVAIPSDAKKLAKVTFTYAGQDVTSELMAGTFTTSLFGPSSGPVVLRAKITPKAASQGGGKCRFTVTATSKMNTSVSGQATIGGKFKKVSPTPTPTPAP